jgi:PAS domain S-box-containing protein
MFLSTNRSRVSGVPALHGPMKGLFSVGERGMEQPTTHILERSSDAIVIIRLTDKLVLGANEAFFAVTGHSHDELTGQYVHDLFSQVGLGDQPTTLDQLEHLRAFAGAPTALWTRAGELRYGHLSAFLVDGYGGRDAVAVCAIRDIRDPTPTERRLAARVRFTRVVEAGGPRLEVATRAMRALGESLRWELGALWLMTPHTQSLSCAVVWRSPWAELTALEESSRRTTYPPGVGLVGRLWRHRRAMWVTDVSAERVSDPCRRLDEVGDPVHGWFGFPVWAGDEMVGIVELFSRQIRQPDHELLEMTEELGRLIGRHLGDARGRPECPDRAMARIGQARPRGEEPPPETVPSSLRGLREAATTVAGAMEQRSEVRSMQGSPEWLGELAAIVGKLDRLLEDAMERRQGDLPEGQSEVVSTDPGAEPPMAIPTGLTLKAVSRRTGIPAATLRTWERRYGFLRPVRSANGYRLYGEREVAQVLQVKRLLEQGVRIGAVMETVMGASRRPQAAG